MSLCLSKNKKRIHWKNKLNMNVIYDHRKKQKYLCNFRKEVLKNRVFYLYIPHHFENILKWCLLFLCSTVQNVCQNNYHFSMHFFVSVGKMCTFWSLGMIMNVSLSSFLKWDISDFFVFVVSVDLGFLLPEKKYFLHRAEHHWTLIYDCYLVSISFHGKEQCHHQ